MLLLLHKEHQIQSADVVDYTVPEPVRRTDKVNKVRVRTVSLNSDDVSKSDQIKVAVFRIGNTELSRKRVSGPFKTTKYGVHNGQGPQIRSLTGSLAICMREMGLL